LPWGAQLPELFDEILQRVWLATGLRNQTELAHQLDIRPASISDAKKRGNFPADWTIKLSLIYRINSIWILTGEGPMMIEGAPVTKPQTEGKEAPLSDAEALEQTAYILRSKTVYRGALLSNIRAFHQGVKREEEMQGVQETLAKMQAKYDADTARRDADMEELKRLIRDGGAAPEKRDPAANA
jgi:hypothetical protein